MDLSSLSEVQQEQLQDLQEKFKEHQAQRQQQEQQLLEQYQLQQQQNQHYASQVYDPSQVQEAYDPNHAYYDYYQQHSHNPQHNQLQHQEQQQQLYGFDQSGYENPYQQQLVQQESVPVQAAGVTVNQEGAARIVEGSGEASGQGQVQHQQNMYNSSDPLQQKDMTTAAALAAIAAYPGLNPAAAAAVAALSQLTQFAGTMGDAERAMSELHGTQFHGNGERFGPMTGPEPFPGHMRSMVGQPPFRGGGGRRGRRPFRGSNRGNVDYRHPRPGGSVSTLRGWGRGRGRGRGGNNHFPSHNDASSESSQPNALVGDNVELSEQKEPSVVKAEVETDTTPSVPAPVMVASKPGPSQTKWSCEICKVDCNSLDILEQHKNGKKHMKNLQKNGQLKFSNQPGSQQEVIKVEQLTDSIQQPTEVTPNLLASDQLPDSQQEVVQVELDSIQQHAEVTPNLQASEQLKSSSLVGTKRKTTKSGRGKKRARTFESRQQYEPPKPKVVIPIMCNLCNIKCDTQEVFDRHLAGKKHISKQKRYEGHQAMYGPMVQALYPPNPIAQNYYHPQGQQEQPFYGTQSLYPPLGPYVPPVAHEHAAAPMGYYPPQNYSSRN